MLPQRNACAVVNITHILRETNAPEYEGVARAMGPHYSLKVPASPLIM